MNKTKNVFLIGPMASGKSSVGKALASLTPLHFFDLDEEIERHAKLSISQIFSRENEAGFRLREAAIVKKFSQLSGIILATGGGTVLHPDNRGLLSSKGYLIYLKVGEQEQLKRLQSSSQNRPLLKGPNPVFQLQLLNSKREVWYERLAQKIYHTDKFISAHAVASKIREDLASTEIFSDYDILKL